MMSLVTATIFALITLQARVYGSAIPLMEAMAEPSLEDNSLDPNAGFQETHRDWVALSKSPPIFIRRLPGAITELECEASGSPAPTIHWLRDNQPINEPEEFESNILSESSGKEMAKARSRLIINNMVAKEKSTYTCFARAGRKTAFFSTVVFTNGNLPKPHNISEFQMLKEMYKPRIVSYYTTLMDTIGETLIVPCKAIGNPRPEIYWTDNEDEPISQQDPRLKIMPSGELIIQGIRWSDMGVYTCIARNPISKDSISTFVYPLAPEN